MAEQTEETKSQVESKTPAQLDKEKNVNAIAKHENVATLNRINLFDDKQLVAAENLLNRLMKSEKGGIKSVNDGIAMLIRAQDLNLPFSSCLEHIHVINGKTGIDIHIVKALLSKAGCTWRCTKDYQPLYEYTDGFNVYNEDSLPEFAVKCISSKQANEKAAESKDDTETIYVYPVRYYQGLDNNVYKDYQLNTKQFQIVINKQQIAEVTKAGKIPVYRIANKPIDYVTEYEITRTVNGKEVTSIGKFSYMDAIQADMFEKDTYKKYPKVLIAHRAFTLAARDIASDILMGVMETTELKIVAGKEIASSDIEIEDADAIEI